MHTIRTKSFHHYDHPEFEIIINLKEVGQDYLRSFVEHLQNLVAGGQRFKAGDSIQYGFFLIQVTQGDHDYLRLDEPNNKGLPVTFKPGVTQALHAAMTQLKFAESYGIDTENLAIPTMLQSGYICSDKLQKLVLGRSPSKDENDSGWFVGSFDEAFEPKNLENLKRVSLYEIVHQHPQLIPWLAFPVDTLIVFEDDQIEVSCSDEILELQEDSFLAEQLK